MVVLASLYLLISTAGGIGQPAAGALWQTWECWQEHPQRLMHSGEHAIPAVPLPMGEVPSGALHRAVVLTGTASPSHEPEGGVQLPMCDVQFLETVDVPSLHSGPIHQLNVKLHQRVEQGAALARLAESTLLVQKRAAMLARDAAAVRMKDEVDMAYAEATRSEAEEDLRVKERIERDSRSAISASDMRRARLALERARLEVDRTLRQRKLAKIEYDLAEAEVAAVDESIRRLEIKAPLAGAISRLYHSEGEWVDAGEPIVQIVRLDRLRVVATLEGSKFSPRDVIGCAVSVEAFGAGGERIVARGRVESSAPEVTPSGLYYVYAEIDNPTRNGDYLLRPGMHATLTLFPGQSPAVRPPAVRSGG